MLLMICVCKTVESLKQVMLLKKPVGYNQMKTPDKIIPARNTAKIDQLLTDDAADCTI